MEASVTSSSPSPGWSARYGASSSTIRSCQVVVRLYPSKRTAPSITATKATVPGTRSAPASPVNGHRRRIAPSTTWSGASRARRPNRTAKPSPCAPTCRDRTPPSRRARRRCRARSRRRAPAGSPGRAYASSSVANAKIATAPGQRPSRSGILGERPRLGPGPLPQPDERVGDRAPRARAPATRCRAGPRAAGRRARRSRRSRSARGSGTDPCRRRAPPPRRGRRAPPRRPGRRCASGPVHEPREPVADGAPPLVRREQRPLPERPEQDERDDEDDGRAPVEHPRRDREVLDRPDPVCDDVHGLTVSTASTASGWWSSTSNRPGIVAVSGSRTGFPGVIGRSTS